MNITNVEVNTYFTELHRALNDLAFDLEVTRSLGGGDMGDKRAVEDVWRKLRNDASYIRIKANRCKKADIENAVQACMLEYEKTTDRQRYIPADELKFKGYKEFDFAVGEVVGEPTKEIMIDAGLKNAWYRILQIVDEVMAIWEPEEPKLDLPESIQVDSMKIGKLSPMGAERLYQLCKTRKVFKDVDRKIFKDVDRKIFEKGFKITTKDEQILEINTKDSFMTLFRNSDHIFMTLERKDTFFDTFDYDVAEKAKRAGTEKDSMVQKKFAESLKTLK